jgi:drug/metabolite transporter (DMT)-like permease
MLVKQASLWCSGTIISLFRFVVGGFIALLIIMIIEKRLAVRDRRVWLIRGILGGITMSATYLGIEMTSSGRAILLINTYPIFAVVFGVIFFRERAEFHNVLGLIICITGILFVFHDSSSYVSLGNIICLAGGVLNGLAVNFIKIARMRNSPASVYLSCCLFGMAFNSSAFLDVYGIPMAAFVILILTAVLALMGQILLGYGFRYVSATKGSIIGFFETQLTLLISWGFLGEEISPKLLTGALIILLGLIVNQSVSFKTRQNEKTKTKTEAQLSTAI